MLDGRNNIVLISGATPSVGKSFVSANLAAVLAASGKRVLLVDADLRKGHLNEYLGVARSPGLSEILSGRCSFEQARKSQVLANLDVLTTGAYPGNPAELLSSVGVKRFLEDTSSHYDVVLLDSAPVLVAADTSSIAPHAGTFLLVARAGQTHIGELQESMRRLSHSGAVVSGAVFNAMDVTKKTSGGYGYAYAAYTYK
jgi:tyrosine-protein kinase Etk/Wzc